MPSKKIEVQLVGDASDLERSLAGALVALKAFGDRATTNNKNVTRSFHDAKTGMYDFEKAGDAVAKKLTGGPFGLLGALGNLSGGITKLGGNAQKVFSDMGKWASSAETFGGSLSGLGSVFTSLAPILGTVTVGVAAFGAALLVLPAAVAAVTFVLVALLDTVTTLTAIFAAFVAPVTLVTGLLGGLGAAFAYVTQQSLANKMSAQDQKDVLTALHVAQQTYNADLQKYGKNATQTESALIALHKAQDAYAKSQVGVALGSANLDDKFHSLVTTLSRDFAPEIVKLVDSASRALSYLNQIAKLPLDQAFHNLATHGVRLFSQFLYGVANTMKHPFKLAIDLAFGGGGATMQNQVNKWWTSFTNYLFGYSKTKSFRIGGHVFMEQKTVAGALKPILDFFNRHNFTKAGLEMANDIISGATKSGGALSRLGQWAGKVAGHAGTIAGKAFLAVFGWELRKIANWTLSLGWIKTWTGDVKKLVTGMWDAAKGYIENHIPHPHLSWGGVVSAAKGVWDSIVSYIENNIPHPSIHLSIPTPSMPSLNPFNYIPHAAGGMAYRGQVSLVGEHGPELRLERSAARYVPAGQTAAILGGGSGRVVFGSGQARGHYMMVFVPESEFSKITRHQAADRGRLV